MKGAVVFVIWLVVSIAVAIAVFSQPAKAPAPGYRPSCSIEQDRGGSYEVCE